MRTRNDKRKLNELEEAIDKNIDLVLFLKEQDNETLQQFALEASKKGNLEIITFIYEFNSDIFKYITSDIYDNAIVYGHLSILKWLFSTLKVGHSSNSLQIACKNGHLNIIEWILYTPCGNGIDSSGIYRGLKSAAENGYLDIVKFICNNQLETLFTEALDLAAKNGHLDIIKFIYSHTPNIKWHKGKKCTVQGMHDAKKHNHTHVVNWLQENDEKFKINKEFEEKYNVLNNAF